jgi:hypothetical protein
MQDVDPVGSADLARKPGLSGPGRPGDGDALHLAR